jgi:hypothetical protein
VAASLEGAPQKIDDVTAQAIAEVRGGASASRTPSPSAASSAETVAAQDATTAPIPLGATVAAVESAPAPNVSGVSGAGATATEINSGRNTERSIRAAPVPKPDASSPRQPAAASDKAGVLRAATAAEENVTLPPFGAMLPVRTLGAIFTLRQSLARLELTRDVRGQGWMLKKGTIFVGQQQGGEFDRAYVSLMGFIAPGSGGFVRLGGDVLGADGRSLSVANYFYLYHQVDAGSATIWIIPTGPRREEGSTHFLLLRPDSLRRWKGAPLSLNEIKNLPAVPQYRQMALFGMTEQKSIDLRGRK